MVAIPKTCFDLAGWIELGLAVDAWIAGRWLLQWIEG